MKKQQHNKAIPKLRFPKFEKESSWESNRLDDVCEIIGGGTPDTKIAKYWNGEIQWFTPTEIKSNFVSKSLRTITALGLKESSAKLLPKGAILLTTRATIGDAAIALEECTTNQGFQSLVVNSYANNVFLLNWIKKNKCKLETIANGSTFREISKSEIGKIKILIPSLPEQQKIAACLSSLDDVIELESEKLTALQIHKKGLLQKLFPAEGKKAPELRFQEFRKEGEWEEKKLGEIAKFLKGKGISKLDISENGRTPCIRYGELYTYYKEKIDSVISFTNLPIKDLVLSLKNDVIIPSSGETKEDIATAACILKEGIALGGDLNIIRSEMDGAFLSYYLNHALKWEIAKIAQGYSVVHLYSSQLQNLKIKIPNKLEQQKIASCLSSIDELIESQSKKTEQLEQHKKGLMQQLFPEEE